MHIYGNSIFSPLQVRYSSSLHIQSSCDVAQLDEEDSGQWGLSCCSKLIDADDVSLGKTVNSQFFKYIYCTEHFVQESEMRVTLIVLRSAIMHGVLSDLFGMIFALLVKR